MKTFILLYINQGEINTYIHAPHEIFALYVHYEDFDSQLGGYGKTDKPVSAQQRGFSFTSW